MNPYSSRDTKLILQVAAGILLAISILWIAFVLSAAPLRQSFTVTEGPVTQAPVTVDPDPQPSLPEQ